MLPLVMRVARATRVALLLWATQLGSAAAQTSPTAATARLEVEAPADCTSRADLERRVRARSPLVRFVDDERVLAIRAEFSLASSGAAAGDVTLTSPGAAPAPRRIVARTCSEAAEAVALIIAFTLDPSAAERTSAARVDATAPTPVPTETIAPQYEPEKSVRDGSDSAGSSSLQPQIAAQIAAQSLFGTAPGMMPGVAVYVELGVERPAIWSPSVVLGATHVARSRIPEPGGVASFALDALSLDACLLRLRLGRLEARPCASVLGGRLSAVGSETRNAAAESRRPFWVVGASAVFSAELVWLLEASARVALGANLVRDSFTFTPQVFHDTGAATAAASLGLGVRWR